MADPPHPIAAILRLLISTVFMPALVVLAWWKALQFDPYRTSFFTKTYIEPTLDMPDEFRIAGWVIIGIGALVIAALANGLLRRRVVFREIWTAMWMGLLLAAFGGAFFLAANRAEEAIAARENAQ
jgi:hypothetical protein